MDASEISVRHSLLPSCSKRIEFCLKADDLRNQSEDTSVVKGSFLEVIKSETSLVIAIMFIKVYEFSFKFKLRTCK